LWPRNARELRLAVQADAGEDSSHADAIATASAAPGTRHASGRAGPPVTFLLVLGGLSLALLVGCWVLYPMAMALRARHRGAVVPPDPPEWPRVTVILATREEPTLVHRKVEALLASDYPADLLDVVVAVDAEGEERWALPPHLSPRARVVRGDRPGGKACALNAGLRATTHEIVVFADTHQEFERDAIAALVRRLGDPAIGAVSGALHLPERGTPALARAYWDYERRLREHEARVASAVGTTGAIWAMRRSLWMPLPDGLILDDVHTPMRLVLSGHRVSFAPEARALERRHVSEDAELRRKIRTLTGNVQLLFWMPALLSPGRNPIWAQFLFHKVLRLLTPYLVAMLLLCGLGVVLLALPRDAAMTLRWVVLGAAAVTGAALLAPPLQGVRRHLWFAARVQLAVITATVNGVRGRWDVWST
jgi:biofilm PGA synthesis N-glycosyltransferase PgaC